MIMQLINNSYYAILTVKFSCTTCLLHHGILLNTFLTNNKEITLIINKSLKNSISVHIVQA